MKKDKYLTGSSLFALARTKARGLGIEPAGLKLEPLIQSIQNSEGHQSCFRKKTQCSELNCCWQRSCKAEMIAG